jgi:hypothetical protein
VGVKLALKSWVKTFIYPTKSIKNPQNDGIRNIQQEMEAQEVTETHLQKEARSLSKFSSGLLKGRRRMEA